MLIRVPDIPDDGLTIEGARQLPEPFQDRAWQLEDLSLRLTRDERDVVVEGRIRARVPQVCSRCLEAFLTEVRPDVDARFAPRPLRREEDLELGSDDLELDFYADDTLNLATLVETETTLALPMKPLCREDCRGLCPLCGGNKNAVECRCEARPPEPRFAALKDLVSRMHPQ